MKECCSRYPLLVLKGMAMGAADVIPGVSGGTIAFITGIYEELIESIKSVNLAAFKLLIKGEFNSFWKAVNGTFLLSIVLGIGISIFSFAKGVSYLLDNYPILVWSFFFGLIIASTIYVIKEIKSWNAVTLIAIVAGAALAWYITMITPARINISLWSVFISGAIAICAMILPGISGSFILVLMGMYKYILEAVGSFNLPVIIVFIAGALIGIISFSNLLSWLLKNYHNSTIALLAGFMAGSLNKVWPWKKVINGMPGQSGATEMLIEKNVLPGTYEAINGTSSWLLAAILIAISGFVIIFVIEALTKKSR